MVTYTDYLNKFINIIFKGLAYGIVAEILMVTFFLLLLFLVVALLKDYNIFIFLFMGKVNFAKKYLYYFYLEKIRFLKSFYLIVRCHIIKYLKLLAVFLLLATTLTYVLISFF